MIGALRAIAHRGPDDQGVETFGQGNGIVALGHTRLSIIDLTSAGHQPMMSKDGRYAVVFNGEIYNYKELRQRLINAEGIAFSSDSDTEVLVECWAAWGKECLSLLVGMFAFIVYDLKLNKLTCIRDAFGVKPLFYSLDASGFTFSSEISALEELRNYKAPVNLQRAYDYLVFANYDSEEDTFLEGIQSLRPGNLIEVDLSDVRISDVQQWWLPSIKEDATISFSSAVESVREAFLSSVKLHLRSDVTLGAALSGGVDSSAVVCAMRHLEPDLEINTFSYIAGDSDISEEKWVDKINDFVGARSYKAYASGHDLMETLHCMIKAQGEPFGSTSIYAQYQVFKLAREQGVTVTLDGQGADELLAGYSGYPGYRLASLLEMHDVSGAIKFAKSWAHWPNRRTRDAWMSYLQLYMPPRVNDFSRALLGRGPKPIWLNTEFLNKAGVVLSEKRPLLSRSAKGRRVVERLAYSLQERGLPELLRHGDRNSMLFHVESRVPFLTIPIANLLLSLPEHYLISAQGETKHVFRKAMQGIVPNDVLARKDKIGFATPERDWIRRMQVEVRKILSDSADIPFMKSKELCAEFDDIIAGNKKFSWQVWRWVNYILWYRLRIN